MHANEIGLLMLKQQCSPFCAGSLFSVMERQLTGL